MFPSTHLSLLTALRDNPSFGAAWAQFQRRYADTVRRWCLQPADAEDVAQGVLLRLVRALPNHQHDPSRPFRNWLKALVENAIRDFYRAQNRHPADRGVGGSDVQQALANLVDPNGLEDLADAVEGLNDPRLAAAMDRVRQRVADATWRAFWAATADGRPAAEVAAELGISVGSVFKAKYRVASLLAQEYPLAGGG